MNTYYQVILVVGCTALGVLIGYAWWSFVRTSVIRLDLAGIRDRLDAQMKAKGTTGDPHYLWLRKIINCLIEYAPHLSVTQLYFLAYIDEIKSRRLKTSTMTQLDTAAEDQLRAAVWSLFTQFFDMRGAPEEVQEAKFLIIVDILLYVVIFSVSGFALLVYAGVSGRFNWIPSKIARWIDQSRGPKDALRIASTLSSINHPA